MDIDAVLCMDARLYTYVVYYSGEWTYRMRAGMGWIGVTIGGQVWSWSSPSVAYEDRIRDEASGLFSMVRVSSAGVLVSWTRIETGR